MVVGEDLRLYQHSLVHLTVAPVAASWYHSTLYVAVSYRDILYADTWVCSAVPSYSIMFIWYYWDQSLISVIRCIFQHHWQFICDIQTCTCSIMIRWSIMYFPVIYTCILSGSACTWYADMLYFLWAWVCPPQTMFLSDILLWLGRLNSGEVLLGFWQISFPCTCLIYFGHHVPLLTSYIRGHLL